jgi:hypothetical protein
MLLEVENVAKAETMLATLPFVRCGLVEFEIMPLRPYPGYARLFAC